MRLDYDIDMLGYACILFLISIILFAFVFFSLLFVFTLLDYFVYLFVYFFALLFFLFFCALVMAILLKHYFVCLCFWLDFLESSVINCASFCKFWIGAHFFFWFWQWLKIFFSFLYKLVSEKTIGTRGFLFDICLFNLSGSQCGFFFFFPSFFKIYRKKKKNCKEEVMWGEGSWLVVGLFLGASRQGEEKLALLDLVFVFDRSFFTQPSQCERICF